MKRHLFLVATYAVAGKGTELNQWYRERHLDDLLKVPGIVSGQRFDVSAIKLPQGIDPPDCLVIYEMDTSDPSQVMAELGRRQGTPDMQWTDALDSSRTLAFVATPMG